MFSYRVLEYTYAEEEQDEVAVALHGSFRGGVACSSVDSATIYLCGGRIGGGCSGVSWEL